MSPDLFLKRFIANSLHSAAQAGQYNLPRARRRGDVGMMYFTLSEFCEAACQVGYLINRQYMPYYKWSFRAMRALPRLALTAELLEYLLTTDNEADTAEEKYNVMEGIAADITGELREQGLAGDPQDRGLTGAVGADLEKYAYLVNDRIGDAQIRNMHVLAAV